MRKIITLLSILCFSINTTWALDVSVSHAAFKGEKINYVEINLYIVGLSLSQTQVDSVNSQGSLDVTVLFKQKGQVSKYDKFVLKSPPALDPVDFSELRRYELDNGVYDIEVQFKDLKKEENVATFKSMFIMDFDERSLRQSDINLLSRIKADSSDNKRVKNGQYLDVLPYQHYDRTYSKLIFYNEIYNTDKYSKDDFTVNYTIEKANNVNNELSKAIGNKKEKPSPVITNLVTMDIKNLESGNYRLIVSIRNSTNDLLSQKEVFFQRGNEMMEVNLDTISAEALQQEFVAQMDDQQLKYSLSSISMNIPDSDIETFKNLMANPAKEAKQRFLLKYWAKRNPTLPEQAHDEYMMVARAADKTYNNGFGYGFETDRGRIFMRYGRPDDVTTVENESGAPPYEVWLYEKLSKSEQTNVKFLFYNPKLTANGHILLHSNCFGETQNGRWKEELYKNFSNNNSEGKEVKINRKAEQIFNGN